MKLGYLLVTSALVGFQLSDPSAAYAQAAPNVPAEGQTTPTGEVEVPVDANGEQAAGNTIVVTGSRIKRPEFSGVLPGVQVDREAITTRGFTNALEVLNDIPLVGPGAGFNGNNGGQAASLGSAFIDLLDIGTSRTLTLVNGRRFVSGNAASLFVADNATGGQVDVNTIPVSLIQRVDVLTVGGAAAYGADAIAGVVNYILRDDYEGNEVTAISGISDEGDAASYTLRALYGLNFAGDRGNVILSGEYNHLDGLQADARDFRRERFTTIVNFLNGGTRNTAFGSGIINVAGSNNGAFLRATDDLQPASVFGSNFQNLGLSFSGTILNTLAALPTPYVPLTQTVGTTTRTSNFIALANGIGPVGIALAGTGGTVATPNTSFFNTAVQLVNGVPGAPLISGNGRNGRTTPAAGLAFTTFAPTVLPADVTPAQVLTAFNVAAPADATAAQLATLAINVLQANRPTAREFFAANPNVDENAFIGTFIPGVPRVANTDTTLVTVGGVQVPVNQVLPFVARPLEFTADGRVRQFTAATLTPTTPSLYSQSFGADGGFNATQNIVLRTEQDRYIGNLNAKFNITPNLTFFTENLYADVRNISRRNSPSQNFVATGAENAALVLNVNNPFLDAEDRAALAAVGITSALRGGSFALTRQNQDIFGDNPFTNRSKTFRLVNGLRTDFGLLGRELNAELSATYGKSTQRTNTTNLLDVEYNLALDAVQTPNGIRCRAQVDPAAYLGRTPVGVASNLTRLPGEGGIPTEAVFTPTITQAMIDACSPLNPFGFNQMSEESKRYVRADTEFRNKSTQLFIQGFVTGSPFDLPAGPLSISLAGEYRKETLDFRSDALNQLGRSRTAPSAQTKGTIRVYEGGIEARIPVTSEDFLPFLGNLEFNPAYRLSQQSGSSETYRNLQGALVSPRAKGKTEKIFAIAGTWQPIRDITFRGNITRSVRQPSIVELFLGGQPAFAAPNDPCATSAIDTGTAAATRRANCVAAVTASGVALAPGQSAADFLASFVAQTGSLAGSFSGASTLQAEKGRSKTGGIVLTPRFVRGLSLSADYISLNLNNIIQPTSLAQALQFCFDSSTFPDTSAQTGSNTCSFFMRGADFQVQPGFGSGFINLASTKIRAFNFSGRYTFNLPSELGRLEFRGNAYHLKRFDESASGLFDDTVKSAGSFNRPKWETQASGRYSTGPFFTQLTWNWRDKTTLFSNGLASTIENFENFNLPSTSLFDLAIGFDIPDRFRLQFVVANLTDKKTAGNIGLFTGGLNDPNGGFLDQIGRRYQVTTSFNF